MSGPESEKPAVTRRELLTGVAGASLMTLAGCNDGPSVSEETIGSEPTPGWKAVYDTYIQRRIAGRSNLYRTLSGLTYAESNWVANGNPMSEKEQDRLRELRSDSDVETQSKPEDAYQSPGAWKHTFVYTSTAFVLTKDEPHNEGGSYRIDPNATKFQEHVTNQLIINISDEDEILSDENTDGDLDPFILSESETLPVGLSVRQDEDLTGSIPADKLEERLLEVDADDREELFERLARDPRGVETLNFAELQDRIEENTETTSGVIGIGMSLLEVALVAFVIPEGISTLSALGIGAAGILAVIVGIFTIVINSVIDTLPGQVSPPADPEIGFNEGFARIVPPERQGDAAAHYVVFDLYVPAHRSGSVTVRSGFQSTGGGSHADYIDDRAVRPIWKVTADPLPPGPELDIDTEGSCSNPPNSERYSARIETTSFRNKENKESGNGLQKATLKPRPKPAISGRVKAGPGQHEYCASETVLSAGPIEEYRWTLYRAPYDIDGTPALQALLNLKLPINEYNQELKELEDGEGEAFSVEYNRPGRYVLELKAVDKFDNTGRTRQDVIIGNAPEAQITVSEPNSETLVLSAAETKDADSELSNLTIDWTVIVIENDLLNLDEIADASPIEVIVELLNLSGLPTILSGSGVEFEIQQSRITEGTTIAIMEVADESGLWDRTVRVIESEQAGPQDCMLPDQPTEGPTSATATLASEGTAHAYLFENTSREVIQRVRLQGGCNDIDLFINLDGSIPSPGEADLRDRDIDSDAEIALPPETRQDLGILVFYADDSEEDPETSVQYHLTVEDASEGELRRQ